VTIVLSRVSPTAVRPAVASKLPEMDMAVILSKM
jgi:hypothetical protein